MSNGTIGRTRRRAMLALAAAAAIISSRAARGDDFNWNSSVHSGNWGVETDWIDFQDPGNDGPPTSDDNARIGFGDTVSVSDQESALNVALGYVFGGSQQHACSASLIVSTNGFLNVNYIFSTTISAYIDGQVLEGKGSSVAVNGGDIQANEIDVGAVGSAATFNVNTGGQIQALAMVISGASTATVDTGADLQIQSVGLSDLTGSTLTVQNSSSINFQGAPLSVDTGASLAVKNNSYISGGYLSVGNVGSASMTVDDSSEVEIGGASISNGGSISVNGGHFDATQTASIYPDGNSNDYNFYFPGNPGEFDVGGSGSPATLNLNNGGEVDCLSMDISDGSNVTVAGSPTNGGSNLVINQNGQLTIEGGGSLIAENSGEVDDIGGNLKVGSEDSQGLPGSLTVETASRVYANQINVSGGSTVLVDGEGSFVSVGTTVAEGGTLTVQDAGAVFDTLGVLANGSTVTVTGGGSTWTNSNLYLGYSSFGSGSLIVQNGGFVSASGAIIDDNNSTIHVSGVGTYGGASTLQAGGNLYVGYSTFGGVNVQSGGYVSDLNGFIGYLPASTGSSALIVDSIWNNSQGLYVNAGGTLSLQVGATVTAASGSAASTSSISILSGSTLAVSGVFANSSAITDSALATFGSLTGNGSVSIGLGSTLALNPTSVGSLANGITGTGELVMSGPGELIITSSNVPFSGSVDVSNGTLQLENPSGAIGTCSLEVDAAGKVDLDGHPLTLTSLSGSGIVDNATIGGSPTLTVNSTGNSAFYGSIRDSTGTVGLTKSGAGTLSLFGVDTYGGTTTVNAGAALQLGSTGALPTNGAVLNNGFLIVNANSIAGSETGSGTTITEPGVTFTVDFAQGSLINNGATVLSGTGQVGSISGNGALTLLPSATLQVTGSGVSTVNTLALQRGAGMDLTHGGLAINFGSPAKDPISTIVGYLRNGYGTNPAPTWSGQSGTGGVITSSTAAGSHSVTLGYLDGNIDTALPAVSANQVLVKYTLVGDSDLSGEVDFTDLASVLKHFNQSGTDWAAGNFEYAANSPSIASTNFNDLADVLKNFLQTTPGGASESIGGNTIGLSTGVQIQNTVAPLPEPASLSLLAAGAAGLLSRRRRRSRI